MPRLSEVNQGKEGRQGTSHAIKISFQRVVNDLVGPLPRIKKGNRFILMYMDYCTKYPDAIPLRATTSRHVADALLSNFSHLGLLGELLSNNGSTFNRKLMQEVMNLIQIKRIHTPPYHPRTNVMLERFHAMLKGMMSKVQGQFPDPTIPSVLFMNRETQNQSTGYSLFQLLNAHDVRGPQDLLGPAKH